MVVLKHALLIANPASRRGGTLTARAMKAIERAGLHCELARTERPGHAAELAAARGTGVDVVFTLGGDGTAMEAAGALAYTDVPVAVLAGGTGNLLSRAIGVPMRVERAVPALLGGTTRLIDLGVLRGHRFAVAAGVGIDAAMVEETPAWLKRRIGVLAYTIMATRSALRAVLRRQFFTVRITVDGEIIERRAAAVLFANFGAILEDRLTFGPDIASDDGVLDLCIFSPRGLGDSMRIMWRVTRRDFRPDPAILYRKGTHFRIETDPVLTMQADGELLGPTPADITVEPRAVRLLIPHRAASLPPPDAARLVSSSHA
ncbi:MAG: diacylglycerol kinase family lipid kinase [Gemmatimonadaceae bacterium]|nr:diacylglycerol kinase family lipid kinase [Gemmatimonadaceae bacterium]